MHVRELRDSDIPTLRAIYEKSGFEYSFPDLRGPLMENVQVVVDEKGQPIMAAAAERILQAYLLVSDGLHPATKLRGIKMLHDSLATPLREKHYTEINCFIPPTLAKSFGRRLMRTFQWVPNWVSFARFF